MLQTRAPLVLSAAQWRTWSTSNNMSTSHKNVGIMFFSKVYVSVELFQSSLDNITCKWLLRSRVIWWCFVCWIVRINTKIHLFAAVSRYSDCICSSNLSMTKDIDPLVLRGQYHVFWCPGDIENPVISNHGVDIYIGLAKYSRHTKSMVKIWSVIPVYTYIKLLPVLLQIRFDENPGNH